MDDQSPQGSLLRGVGWAVLFTWVIPGAIFLAWWMFHGERVGWGHA